MFYVAPRKLGHLWNTIEHFMLNDINKWKQNGMTSELDNNTFAQPNNVAALAT